MNCIISILKFYYFYIDFYFYYIINGIVNVWFFSYFGIFCFCIVKLVVFMRIEKLIEVFERYSLV